MEKLKSYRKNAEFNVLFIFQENKVNLNYYYFFFNFSKLDGED